MQLAFLAVSLAMLSVKAVAELAERQTACPTGNSTFYLVAKILGGTNGQYGAVNPQGPYPVFTPNVSSAIPYYLDSNSRLHATTLPDNYVWMAYNYDKSGDPDVADEFTYVSIYKPYKDNSAIPCELLPIDGGGCRLSCSKRIYDTAISGYITLRQLYLCASRPRGVALGTSTPNTQYRCKKLEILVQAI